MQSTETGAGDNGNGQRSGASAGPSSATLGDQIGAAARETLDEARKTAREGLEEVRAEASRLADKARERARGYADDKKTMAAGRISAVAGVLRRAGEEVASESEQPWVGQFAGQAADALDDFSATIRQKDLGDLVGDLEDYARSHPAVFIGGAVLAGLMVGRFLKASAERSDTAESAAETADRPDGEPPSGGNRPTRRMGHAEPAGTPGGVP